MNPIRYRCGYKYQLAESYVTKTRIFPPEPIETKFIIMRPSGLLAILEGYSWDGPSGPTFDTKCFMRGSLVHDALAQLMRLGLLPKDHLDMANRELERICIEDGMPKFIARCVYLGVKLAGTSFISHPRKIITAGGTQCLTFSKL